MSAAARLLWAGLGAVITLPAAALWGCAVGTNDARVAQIAEREAAIARCDDGRVAARLYGARPERDRLVCFGPPGRLER
jgi:hypothetical protein